MGGLGGRQRWWLLALPAGFLLVFFVYPVVTIIGTGLTAQTAGTSAIVDVLARPSVWRVAWFTVWQAVLSTIATLAVGLPAAYMFSRFSFAGKQILRSFVMVPFVLPTVVVGSAFLAVLGPASPLNGLFAAIGLPGFDLRRTATAIIIAHVFFNYAVVVRTVGGLWSHLDRRIEDAARTLGASAWQVVRDIHWPLIRPAVTAAASIVFLFTFTSFGVVLILGGPTRATIEVEIHRATTQLLDLPTASILALLQLVAVVASLVAYDRLKRRHVPLKLMRAEHGSRPAHTPGERWFVSANLAIYATLLLLPLAVLAQRSFTGPDETFGVANYRALWSASANTIFAVVPGQAVINSVVIALVSTIFAVIIGLSAALAATQPSVTGTIVDRALMLPLGTSAVTVGFGFLIAFSSRPLAIRGSLLLVPIAQALIGIPFVVRTLLPVLRSIDPRLREAASTLGALPRQVWTHIDVAIVSRAVLVSAGFAFAVALGEFGATVFLARAQHPTMPVAIFRLLGRPGMTNFGQAMAMSTILMVVTASVTLTIERLKFAQIGRF